MNSALEAPARLSSHIGSSLRRLAQEPSLLGHIELSLEALYASVPEPRVLVELVNSWRATAEQQPRLLAWCHLLDLALEGGAKAKSSVTASVQHALPMSAFLVSTEAARLVWVKAGAVEGWRFLQEMLPIARVRRVFESVAYQETPLLAWGCCSALELAALNGAWSIFEELRACITNWAPRNSNTDLLVGLAVATADLTRGNYATALDEVARITSPAQPGLRRQSLSIKLAALVALGAASSPEAQSTLQEYLELQQNGPDDASAQAAHEFAQTHDRVRLVVAGNKELRAIFRDQPREPTVMGPEAEALYALFEAEAVARRVVNDAERRAKALSAVLIDAENLMLDGRYDSDPNSSMRLRLLWCRLVFELDYHDSFGSCHEVLSGVIDQSTRVGARPLQMLAYDLRGMVRAESIPADWEGAIYDSAAAAEIGTALLDGVAGTSEERARLSRSYLEDLLPVFDRVIELRTRGAVGIASLLQRQQLTVDSFDASIAQQQTAQGSWQRFGRELHAYAERAQALALDGARRARQEGDKLGLARPFSAGAPCVVLDELRSQLRVKDAVLQYFLIGRYLLTFSYGRAFFAWNLAPIAVQGNAETYIENLVDRLRAWTQGARNGFDAAALAELCALILPIGLEKALTKSEATHLRIVPHGSLYRIPYGRIPTEVGSIAERFSLSLHPTGKMAVQSARSECQRATRTARVGHVVGPELDESGVKTLHAAVACAEAEREALRAGLGHLIPTGLVQALDGWQTGLAALISRLRDFDLLHFTCHGREGRKSAYGASMLFGDGPANALDSRSIAQLDLGACTLVVLQSCWTGWMDHRRACPVQGMPQAFCDAGVRAVIAPLTEVPTALAATFSNVLYRALRFLPAEIALQRALLLMREYGSLLVRGDSEAERAFIASGSNLDGLEYRYTGATSARLGTNLSRAVGRLAFWWYERRLRKSARSPALPAVQSARPLTPDRET